MDVLEERLIGLAVALGLGLLIGTERERSKGQGPDRQVAGVRTFALTSLTGAIALTIDEWALVSLSDVVGLLAPDGMFGHLPFVTTRCL